MNNAKNPKEKYRKLFQESKDAIFIADAQTGIILDCNNAAALLVGMDKSELIGQQLFHPSCSNACERRSHKRIETTS